jgi:enoyl-CoA hydratase
MPIHYELDDEHIVTITIDRPEARNSLDLHHFSALAKAWKTFGDDPDAWVAIITGVGDAFCTGADLKTFIPQVTEFQKQIAAGEVTEFEGVSLRDSTDAVLRNAKLYKPIVAAVNGHCVAGGMEMLGGIDIRIATEHATFGVLEPARGLFAGGGTTVRLPRQLPFALAMEFLLCADQIDAQRAFDMGLINQVVAEDDLLDAAFAFAERITKNAPLAVQATKRSVLEGLKLDLREAFRNEGKIAQDIFMTEDAKEGPRAFKEKRAPEWQGR